ncbi:Aste57867_16252 [Aphanomyces stellatus]|uniref:Aste57867_16252 protein n=1 Tax=Aphanomyces stellatus TaxID=120398 RepID=A0A485L5A0_9STRA|nr:hypothetical protein As57867_016195 [Aphanomyces stellatus]VFT93030.1 Aste57867_16252 [Aphanomyces stellatus]
MQQQWTDRDEYLLRQCVFESAYDFHVAAAAFVQRLPKQRKLMLGGTITADVCERQYMVMCEREDAAEGEGHERNEPQEALGGDTHDGMALTVLELPLSESDVDLLLDDIALPSTNNRNSEMQWVLSYLEDPTNAVDDTDIVLDPRIYVSSGDDCLAQLDVAFQASRDRSLSNRSFDNIHRTSGDSELPRKDAADVVRPPSHTTVAVQVLAPLGSPPAVKLPTAPAVQSNEAAKDDSAQPPPAPWQPTLVPFIAPVTVNAEEGSAAEGSDTSSDVDEEDWDSIRRNMKERTTYLPRTSGLAPHEPSGGISDVSSVMDAADEDPSEVRQRELMKQWKLDVERQEKELQLAQEDAVHAERERLRQTFESLLQPDEDGLRAPGLETATHPTVFGYANPYALNVDAVDDNCVRDGNMRTAPRMFMPSTAESKPLDGGIQPVPSEAPRSPIATRFKPPQAATDATNEAEMKRLIEQSILRSDALCEPLYHRQLSHAAFVPVLPAQYWNHLFCYGMIDDAEDDDVVVDLDHVHVLALSLDSSDDEFITIVELFSDLHTSNDPSCMVLGLLYTVASEPLDEPVLLPPSQGHAAAKRVLYIALACDTAHLDAIFRSPMDAFLDGKTKSLGDYLTLVKNAADFHALHLFTRLPAFQVFHQKLPNSPSTSTSTTADSSVVVLGDPRAHIAGVLRRTRTAGLDLVGLKLCFHASFEPNLVVSPDVVAATSHVALAFRGVNTTTTLRELLHDFPKSNVYIPHGALQAKRDLVHWFGGRVHTSDVVKASTAPRARPVYAIALKPDQRVAFDATVDPARLGDVLGAFARTGYDLVGLVRMAHSGKIKLAFVKENASNAFHLAQVRATLTDVLHADIEHAIVSASPEWAMKATDQCTNNVPQLESISPPLFVDFDREQTLLAVITPAAFRARHLDLPTSVGSTLTRLLKQCSATQLVGLKFIDETSSAMLDMLRAMRCVSFGDASPFDQPGAMLAVALRQHVEDGHFKKHFAGLTHVALYTDPTIVHALLQSLFRSPHELTRHPLPSPLDLCFPPPLAAAFDLDALFQVEKSAPLVSALVIKPTDPLAVLPVVWRRLLRDGFQLLHVRLMQLPMPWVTKHAAGKSDHVSHLSSQPSVVCCVRRVNCITRLKALVGPDDPDVARQHARFSLVAGYGIDAVRNGFYTSQTYADARGDLDELGHVSLDAYDQLCRATSKSTGIGVGVANMGVYVVTPRTLVETTVAIIAGPLVDDGGALLQSLVDDGGFRVVNLVVGALSSDQQLYMVNHFAHDVLDGTWCVVALERDNAVSRLATWVSTSKLLQAADGRAYFRCTASAKDAAYELPLFFDEMFGSVHRIDANNP